MSTRTVDTVFGGCYRREVFERIGYWNEALVFSQDIEFNKRLTDTGGTILLVPEIRCTYYSWATWAAYVKHSWRSGLWAVLPLRDATVIPIGVRHCVPGVFVATLLSLVVLAAFRPALGWPALLLAAVYTVVAVVFGAEVALRRRDWRYAVLLPVAFALFHLSYGAGSLVGVVRLALPR